MKYLVTGGAGFIGSNLVEELLKRGETVRVLDNFATGKRENLSEFGPDVEVIEGDIRSYHIVQDAVKGVDFILHQAALPSVPRSVKDPLTSHEVNVTGTINLLMAAREAGVHKVVFASSSSVYGDNPELPKHERMPANPLSPYAVSKLAAETYCRVFSRLYGLKTICLRYFNVFGPRQDPMSQYSAVIPRFITSMIKGRRPVIYGNGEQSRDFTFVSNVTEANILASRSDFDAGISLNAASHGRISLNQLVKDLNRILGTSLEPIYESPRPGDILHSYAEIEAAREAIGFKPSVPFEEGLVRTVEWYRNGRV